MHLTTPFQLRNLHKVELGDDCETCIKKMMGI